MGGERDADKGHMDGWLSTPRQVGGGLPEARKRTDGSVLYLAYPWEEGEEQAESGRAVGSLPRRMARLGVGGRQTIGLLPSLPLGGERGAGRELYP